MVKLVFYMQQRFFLSLPQGRGKEELLLLPMCWLQLVHFRLVQNQNTFPQLLSSLDFQARFSVSRNLVVQS